MAGTNEADDGRLAGRRPRAPRSGEVPADQDDGGAVTKDDEEIDAMTRLLGFLRGDAPGGEVTA